MSKITKNTLCSVEGCGRFVCHIGRGFYRSVCTHHHHLKIASKRNLSLNEYYQSLHPARRFKKLFCENQDGRLGFICTTTIVHDSMLDVDHCDGNPSNNNESNLQTLCKSCHGFKTFIRGDHKSQGRKTLKRNPKNA